MKNFNFSIFKTAVFALGCIWLLNSCKGVQILYSTISVPEEGGVNFVKITTDDDDVASPGYNNTGNFALTTNPSKQGVYWYMYPVIDISPDGQRIGYINRKNETGNVMIKSASGGGGSTQRTFRSDVRDFSFSPDGTKLCYCEYRDGGSGIYMMNVNQGTTVQRISPTNSDDYGPTIAKAGNIIYFSRWEGDYNFSLWSYDPEKGLFSNYSRGMTPCVDPTNDKVIYCSRYTYDDTGNILKVTKTLLSGIKKIYYTNEYSRRLEIWKLDTEKGTEELVLSDKNWSYSSPKVSPDGQWLLITGANRSNNKIWNTNLFVMRTDGTHFTQLTYHPGNDMSGVWAPDGKSIYFVSQRGTKNGTYNVWRMDFTL